MTRHSESLRVSSVISHVGAIERNDNVLMESSLKDPVIDFYNEDRATEDQGVTPWTLSVARWEKSY